MIDITLNNARGGTLSAPFTALSVETLTINGATIPDGTTVALLTPDGGTLTLTHTAGNAATLDLNTIQADAATRYEAVGATIPCILAIGDTDNLLALIPTTITRNVLDDLAPPVATAPTYPTSEDLKAILQQMTAQAQRAEDAVEATETAQKAVAQYLDVTFPSAIEQAEKRLENATTSGVNAVAKSVNQGIGAINTKAQEVNTALDGKLSTANTAINEAVERAETAKGDAVKAKEEASKSAEQASTSASNASKSATNAKTSEDNAKSYATQAENATALKVDKRINTADNSEYPVLIREDKDTYKFLSPHFSVPTYTRFWCDGIYYYFGNYSNYFGILVYDRNLKFVCYIKCDLGASFVQGYADTGFCTKIGDHYFLRYYPRYAANFQIRKLNESGTLITTLEVSCALGLQGVRVLRNERNNHLLVFGVFSDVADDGSAVSRVGYNVYDETLTSQSDAIGGIIKKGTINADTTGLDNWLNFLNITGNTTFVAFADKDDATKTALYYLDENDDLIAVSAIRGKGTFTVGGETRNYFVPRFFYNQRNQYTKYHEFVVCNGEKYHRVRIGYEEPNRYEILTDQGSYAISKETVPSSRYDASSFFTAKGSGGVAGGDSFSMPYVICTKIGVIYRSADNGISEGVRGYTDYAIDPCMLSSNQFNHRAIGNSCIVDDNSPVPRTHLYPVGSYGQDGGAIMFTV